MNKVDGEPDGEKPMAKFFYPHLYIDGRWAAAQNGASYPVLNPPNEQEIATAPDAGSADMDKAIAAARRAFDSGPWPRMSPKDRARVIRRIADVLDRNK